MPEGQNAGRPFPNTDPFSLSMTTIYSTATTLTTDLTTYPQRTGLSTTYAEEVDWVTKSTVILVPATYTLAIPTGGGDTAIYYLTASDATTAWTSVTTSTGPADFLFTSSRETVTATPSLASQSPIAQPQNAVSSTQPATSIAAPNSHLGSGTIAGIVVGALVALIMVVTLILYFLRLRKRRHNMSHSPTETTIFEKAELPASDTTWFDRIRSKRKNEHIGTVNEMPAADETQTRAELEGTAVEVGELASEGRENLRGGERGEHSSQVP